MKITRQKLKEMIKEELGENVILQLAKRSIVDNFMHKYARFNPNRAEIEELYDLGHTDVTKLAVAKRYPIAREGF